MKVNTAVLTSSALDWAVSECEGLDWYFPEIGKAQAEYSSDWEQGGPIIYREKIGVSPSSLDGHRDEWAARIINQPFYYGPTPLIAAMRCYVASKLGEEIDVPEGFMS